MAADAKILELGALAEVSGRLRAAGKTVVLCHGVFDLLHVGHIRHFEEAKAMGDVLVVTLTPDHYVNKGPHRPAFTDALRARVIAALDVVDYVAVNRWPTAADTIRLLKPSLYVKGPDYAEAEKDVTGGITLEADAVRAVGGEVRFTTGLTFSSSKLLNDYQPLFAPDVVAWLNEFRARRRAGDIVPFIEGVRSLRALVVGEAILDEYVYCDTLGKSAKEPILALKHLSEERHAGGSLAIANHLAAFCDRVDLVTYLGSERSHEAFIRAQLHPNVVPTFIVKPGAPTIVKRRFVENYLGSKLMEVYEIDDEPLAPAADAALCATLRERLDACDLAIVADFGHGLLTARARETLCASAKYLAVNTQINAANAGFHTISKYRRADYVCLHEGEVRLDRRDRSRDLGDLVAEVGRHLACRRVMITRGKHGTLLYRDGEGFSSCPSFAIRVLDRLGAGDAVLAVTALGAAREWPSDILAFVANVVGAQAVTIVGNQRAIDRVAVLKSVESLLK